MSSLRHQTDTTPFALPFIGGVVLAVPCRVPQNSITNNKKMRTLPTHCEKYKKQTRRKGVHQSRPWHLLYANPVPKNGPLQSSGASSSAGPMRRGKPRIALATVVCVLAGASSSAYCPVGRAERAVITTTRDGWPDDASHCCQPSSSDEPPPPGTSEVPESPDWRDMRARLLARERIGLTVPLNTSSSNSSGPTNFIHETPLIEVGSVILGGTKQTYGFALRQQYFHKAVCLLLQHEGQHTKGIIINRVSAFVLDGWRVWFGGDHHQMKRRMKRRMYHIIIHHSHIHHRSDFFIAPRSYPHQHLAHHLISTAFISTSFISPHPSSMLAGDVASGEVFSGKTWVDSDLNDGREIVCLHTLDSEHAQRLSMPIIRGVSYTSIEGAKELVSSGARKRDFYLFAGYAGWGPGQLQDEIQRDSWYLAAADSSSIMRELRSLDEAGSVVDGLPMWERLMGSIGKADEVARTRESSTHFPN